MRLIHILIVCLVVGCGAENGAPPPITPEQREAIKHSLTTLGAKVTEEIPEALYLSLRNTHVEIRELGATVESVPRLQRDIQDFAMANHAVANGFLDADETEDFKKWLRAALAVQAPPVLRGEYQQFEVTLSRRPLRAVFTRNRSGEAE
jgi:hypothetical protein